MKRKASFSNKRAAAGIACYRGTVSQRFGTSRRNHSSRAKFLVVAIIAATVGLHLYSTEARSEDPRDHLTRIDPTSIIGDSSEERSLYEHKLFVTKGDVAGYVFLSNGKDGDRSVAIYRASGKKGSLPGNYWVTATEASGRITLPVPGSKKPPVDPRTITVRRSDAPLPASTARVVHELWLAMLERSRPEGEFVLDSPTGIFSATSASGVPLRAATGRLQEDFVSLAAMQFGQSLINYSQSSASERVDYARKLENEANKLLKRVAQKR